MPTKETAPKASGRSFKDIYATESTFTGGTKDPKDLLIVGHDVDVSDWLEDLWDEARLKHALETITPDFVESIVEFGVSEPIKVIKRRDLVFVVSGRRRVLGARAANEILIARKDAGHVLVPFVPAKTDDIEAAVRVENTHRFDDPPWVKARNAARLSARGWAPERIARVMQVSTNTIKNYEHYMALDGSLQAKVEDLNDPEMTFNIAIEIGKLGKGEWKKQNLAWDTLINTGAQISGEPGRENSKNVVKLIKEGKLAEAPPPGSTPADIGKAPVPPPLDVAWVNQSPAAEALNKTPPPAPEPLKKVGVAVDHRELPAKGRKRGGSTVSAPKLSPDKVRLIQAGLEPASGKWATEAEEVAYKILAVVTGTDPTAQSLKKWPAVYAKFQPVVPSPAVGK